MIHACEWDGIALPSFFSVEVLSVPVINDKSHCFGEQFDTWDEILRKLAARKHSRAFGSLANSSGSNWSFGDPTKFDLPQKNDNLLKRPLISNFSKSINPDDGAIICSYDKVQLCLLYYCDKQELYGWRFLNSHHVNAQIECDYFKTSDKVQDKYLHVQKYFVELSEDWSWGYVQFIQTAKTGAKNFRSSCPYGTILTCFICNEPPVAQKLWEHRRLVTVTPISRQTYVSILEGDILQVALPSDYDLYQVGSEGTELKPLRTKVSHHLTKIHEFACQERIVHPIALVFKRKGATQAGVITVVPQERLDGRNYAILSAPLKQFSVILSGQDGVIVRTSRKLDLPTGKALDKDGKLCVKSNTTWRYGTSSSVAYDCICDLANGESQGKPLRLEVERIF